VVAEGVEDAATAEVLLRLGVDQAQGFLYSRALPAADLPLVQAVPQPRRGRSSRAGGAGGLAQADRPPPVRHARPPRPPRQDPTIG